MMRRSRGPAMLAVAALAAAGPARAEEPDEARFEGAVGLVARYSPEYAGAGKHSFGLIPAGFVRYGRITISGAGGFTTRRNDDVERGLAARLVERETLRLSLALRFDQGRNESDSDRLAGMGDVGATLRGRLRLRWTPAGDWSFSTGVNTDLLNRGGGWWADIEAGRQWTLTPDTRLQLGGSVSIAGDTYLRTWYGVSAEQASSSGYPVYQPGAGLRDASLQATLRTEFGPRWAGYVSLGLTRQLGPAADSPLVERVQSWSAGGGLAWRF